jgi:hypothetical protein
VSLLVTSCTIFKSRKSTSTDSTQVVTKDSAAKKDSVSVQSSQIGNTKDSTQEEVKITEEITETVFDTSGKVVVEKKTKKVTEKKKKSGSETKTETKKDSTSVKTEVKKQERDSTSYSHQETVKTKKSNSMPLSIWIMILVLILVYFLYRRFKNRFLLFLPFLLLSCKKDIKEQELHESQEITIAKRYNFTKNGIDTSTRMFKGSPISQRYFTSHYQGYDNMTFLQATRARFEAKNLGGNSLQGVFHADDIVDSSGRRYWLQLGMHQWGALGYFAMIFTRDGLPAPNAVSLHPPIGDLNIGQYYTYHISIRENGNVYIGLDGVDLVYFPLKAQYISGTANYFESVGTTNKPQAMPTIRFNPALEYLDTTWKTVTWCRSGGSGYGVQALGVNDVIMGSNVKTKPGIQLW